VVERLEDRLKAEELDSWFVCELVEDRVVVENVVVAEFVVEEYLEESCEIVPIAGLCISSMSAAR
jgi:hypothetical protein